MVGKFWYGCIIVMQYCYLVFLENLGTYLNQSHGTELKKRVNTKALFLLPDKKVESKCFSYKNSALEEEVFTHVLNYSPVFVQLEVHGHNIEILSLLILSEELDDTLLVLFDDICKLITVVSDIFG